jgi:hypothetical protein
MEDKLSNFLTQVEDSLRTEFLYIEKLEVAEP